MHPITSVYLAGGMANCTDAECKDWREKAKSLLPNIICNDPMLRDYRGVVDAPYVEIVEQDCDDILASDVVLVNVGRDGSWGTAMEIRFAFERGKPVIGFSETGKPWIELSPWVKYHISTYYPYLEDACLAITIT